MNMVYATLMFSCAYLAERQTVGIAFGIGDGGGTTYPFHPNSLVYGTLFVVVWLGIIVLSIAAVCAWVKLPAFTIVGIVGLAAVLPWALLCAPQAIMGRTLWHENPAMATMWLLAPVLELTAVLLSRQRLKVSSTQADLSILARR